MAINYITSRNSFVSSIYVGNIINTTLTCSTITISTFNANNATMSSMFSNYIYGSTVNANSLTTTYAKVSGNTAITNTLSIPGYSNLSNILISTITSLESRISYLETYAMRQNISTSWYCLSGIWRQYYISDAYMPRADGYASNYGDQFSFYI